MSRTLLVTNDFPPRAGGIQQFVHNLAVRQPADSLVVYASRAPGWECRPAAGRGQPAARRERIAGRWQGEAAAVPQQKALPPQRRAFEISANDRRFLRSLRIASDETQEKEVE